MKMYERGNSVAANNWTTVNNGTATGYDWGSSNVQVGTASSENIWGSNIPGSGVGLGVGASGVAGTTVEQQGFNKPLDVANAINVKFIIEAINQAAYLYDSGSHDKKLPATAMDILRKKMKNDNFEPYNSAELKDVFGYIFGDIVSELIETRGPEYDDIIRKLMTVFPEGTGNPVKSEYAGSKYARVGKHGKVLNDIRKFISRNNLKNPTTLAKFLKLWEQFKLNKPEYDTLDVEEVFNSFVSNVK